jgi:tetratricopeptide (TPR) repeat protein
MITKALVPDVVVSIARLWTRARCLFLVTICCFLWPVSISAQQSGKAKAPAANSNLPVHQQEVMARLFGAVNDLKSESDKPAAALLQSEVADVVWRFDEPAARAIFRLAFDSVRQPLSNDSLTTDSRAKIESRQRTVALKTILKRYGLHDRKGAEAWLKEFEDQLKADRTTSNNSNRLSQQQAELSAEMALAAVAQNPNEALRLGLLSLSADETPASFGSLLMALKRTDKALSDVLMRQAFLAMRNWGFKYDQALVFLANYGFFWNGSRLPETSPAEVQIFTQYFADAAGAQAARWRSEAVRDDDDQSSMGNLYSFLTNRALPIVALNAPAQLTLLQTNVAELAKSLSSDQRQQADMLADMLSHRVDSFDGKDADLESRLRRVEQEKNVATRDSLWRSLALQLMRNDPDQALSLAGKIDDEEMRAQTEDDVYLVLMQKTFADGSYDEARARALKFNDANRRAKWLVQIADRVSLRSKDHAEALDLLSQAYAIAAKSDNTPVKLDVLLLIAKEFVSFDQERGFDTLSKAVDIANGLDPKAASKPNHSSGPIIRLTSISVVGGKAVTNDDRPTLNSIDFNQLSAFAERDYLRTSSLGDDLKDHLLRAKYFIAMARSILHLPRQGAGYERTLEEMLSN